MGKIIKRGDEVYFQQEDGEITARLTGFEETAELSHKGSKGYKKIFSILVLIGIFYLAIIFLGLL